MAGDPNWGRIIMALGKTPDIRLDKTAIRISIGDSLIFEDEKEVTDNVEAIRRYLQTSKVIVITVDIELRPRKHAYFGLRPDRGIHSHQQLLHDLIRWAARWSIRRLWPNHVHT